MADTNVSIGENTPEQVAYRLMRDVLICEGKTTKDMSRKELLDTYAECREAAIGFRTRD